MSYRIGDNLAIGRATNSIVYQCAKCGNVICNVKERWKDHTPRLISSLTKAGPRRSASGRFEMREYICSKCGTILDVEVALPEDEPLHDEIDISSLPEDALK